MSIHSSQDRPEWVEGWWAGAKAIPSPNFDERPPSAVVDMVVVHCISLPEGRFFTGAPLDLFLNQLNPEDDPSFTAIAGLKVSAHFLIDRQGDVLQLVSCLHRAWHAGVSMWQGRDKCNDFSIGIELEGTVSQAFTSAQYRSLDALFQAISQHWPVVHWVGHSDIAPGRKFDPGPFFDRSIFPKK